MVTVHKTATVGSWQGIIAGLGSPRQTGVLSYEWAPNGRTLWYTRLTLRNRTEADQLSNQGIVYDEFRMNAQTFRNFPGELIATELRLFDPATKKDSLIAAVPSIASTNLILFRHDWATASWETDSKRIRYSVTSFNESGAAETRQYLVDAFTKLKTEVTTELARTTSIPLPYKGIRLAIKPSEHAQENHLVGLDLDGTQQSDFGAVNFSAIGMGYGLGAWIEQLIAESTGKGGKGIIPVDRERVAAPAARAPAAL